LLLFDALDKDAVGPLCGTVAGAEVETFRYSACTPASGSPFALTVAVFATLLASITGIDAFACFRTDVHKTSGDGFMLASYARAGAATCRSGITMCDATM
jgi:hypothetical protein